MCLNFVMCSMNVYDSSSHCNSTSFWSTCTVLFIQHCHIFTDSSCCQYIESEVTMKRRNVKPSVWQPSIQEDWDLKYCLAIHCNNSRKNSKTSTDITVIEQCWPISKSSLCVILTENTHFVCPLIWDAINLKS
jgi:hypothetical protein